MQAPEGDTPRCLPALETVTERKPLAVVALAATAASKTEAPVAGPGVISSSSHECQNINKKSLFLQRKSTASQQEKGGLRPLGRGRPDTFGGDDSRPFQQRVELVGGKIVQNIDFTRWPANLHSVDFGGRAQPEVQPQVVLR